MVRRTFATLIFAAANLLFVSTIGAQVIVTPLGGAPGVSTDQSVALATVVRSAPPAGFTAATASDQQLAAYGFPPRPSVGSSAYTTWLKLVSPSITRVASPVFTQTVLFNGPAQNLSGKGLDVSNASTTTTNWSGYAETYPAGTFTGNNDFVFAEYIVPKVQQAFGTCDGTWWYSSQWVGFDGAFISGDVLQAGTEADAYCSGGTTSTFYSAWYEWYPNGSVRVSLPGLSGGDLVGTEVWYTTSSPHGNFYIVDYNTQKAVSGSFNPPAGTTYQGNTIEWVVERPGISGGLANLSNYVSDAWNFAYGYAGGNYYEPSYALPGGTVYDISMICPPWNPSGNCSSTTTLSSVNLYSNYTLWFYNSGPSF